MRKPAMRYCHNAGATAGLGICAVGLLTHRARIRDFGSVARSSRGGSGDPPRQVVLEW